MAIPNFQILLAEAIVQKDPDIFCILFDDNIEVCDAHEKKVVDSQLQQSMVEYVETINEISRHLCHHDEMIFKDFGFLSKVVSDGECVVDDIAFGETGPYDDRVISLLEDVL